MELRAKYTQDEIDELGKRGNAFKNPDGHYSYPISDEEDLDNAIHAVGRGGADHDAIRKYIMKRAKALDASDKIPDTWSADGSIEEEKSADPRIVRRRVKKERHRSGPPIGHEVRVHTTEVEIREAAGDSSGDTVEIVGQPVVYNVDYVVRDMLGEFVERMAPGVASDIIDSCDCRFLFNHDGMPLARTLSGTLKLSDTADALQSVATLDMRQNLANDLAVAIERGDVNQMSVGFIVGDDSWNDNWDDRTIKRFKDMPDVSAVTYPASPTTSITIAQRMLMEVPVESRARIRKAWIATNELREGKVLSANNQRLLTDALDALHTADDADIPSIVSRLQDVDIALDKGQDAITDVLDSAGVAAPAVDSDPEPTTMSVDAAHEPRTMPETAEERREIRVSFDDIGRVVCDGLDELHAECCGGCADLWLVDIGPDWVVYRVWGCDLSDSDDSYRIAFESDGETVSFSGDPVAVDGHTTWEPKPDSVLREDEQVDSENRDEDSDLEPESDEQDAIAIAARSRLTLEAEYMSLTRRRR